MIKPITAYGHKILRTVCKEVENTPESKQIMVDLIDTIRPIYSGVGLAAPQINADARMFIARISDKWEIIINPVITKRRHSQKSEEGCLSIPNLHKDLAVRADIIEVEYYNEHFNKRKVRLRGFNSVVFQHEYDHLNGILFIDHFTKEGREEVKEKLNEIEGGKTQTHYDMILKNDIILPKPPKKEDDGNRVSIAGALAAFAGTSTPYTTRGRV